MNFNATLLSFLGNRVKAKLLIYSSPFKTNTSKLTSCMLQQDDSLFFLTTNNLKIVAGFKSEQQDGSLFLLNTSNF